MSIKSWWLITELSIILNDIFIPDSLIKIKLKIEDNLNYFIDEKYFRNIFNEYYWFIFGQKFI